MRADRDAAEHLSLPRQACACDRCARLCHGTPGWFLPGEAERAAAFLGLSLVDFFRRYLIAEWWGEERPWAYVLSPATCAQVVEGRTRADWYELSGRCALLGESGCLLPPDLRPFECAAAKGCVDGYTGSMRLSIAKAWRAVRRGADVQALARGGR